MIQAQNEAHIRRSIGDVFDFLADGSNNPASRSAAICDQHHGGPEVHRSGDHISPDCATSLGYKITSDCRITEDDRPFSTVRNLCSTPEQKQRHPEQALVAARIRELQSKAPRRAAESLRS